ncbi:MAG: FAD-dependent oxidoreductase, partial [Dehalococcoidia bacterium]
SPGVRGDAALGASLSSRGVPFQTSHTIQEIQGEGEVHSVVLNGVDSSMQPVAGSQREIECDTLVLAMGMVPTVELAYLTGCRFGFRPDLGGPVPDTSETMLTSMDGVYVSGDAAGVHEGMVTNPEVAIAQGRIAAIAAAESLGALDSAKARTLLTESRGPSSPAASDGVVDYWSSWLSSLINTGGLDVMVCQCEEVSRRDILDLAPPGYLNWQQRAVKRRDVQALAKDGPVDPDQVKRLTRACMGYCQGRRCREQLAMLLARATGTDLAQVPLASYRPPVRPLPLEVMSPEDEAPEVGETWSEWFGHSSGDFLTAGRE